MPRSEMRRNETFRTSSGRTWKKVQTTLYRSDDFRYVEFEGGQYYFIPAIEKERTGPFATLSEAFYQAEIN